MDARKLAKLRRDFRQQLDREGWTYCVGIDSTLKVIDAALDLGPVPSYSGRG